MVELCVKDWIVLSLGEVEALAVVDEFGTGLGFGDSSEVRLESNFHGVEFIAGVDAGVKAFVESGTAL